MPRAPRQEIPGAIHHVVAKGVSGQEIVRDDYDRRALWMRLGRTVGRYRWRCFAYCFMDTHFHLVLRTPEPNLGRGMQWLCGRYAQEFNSRWGRSGHLFGSRFYSDVVTSDGHFVASVVYVLLNPVKAAMVDRAELWPWSSYAATAGLVEAPSFLDVEGVLEHFDRRADRARRRLVAGVLEAVEQLSRPR